MALFHIPPILGLKKAIYITVVYPDVCTYRRYGYKVVASACLVPTRQKIFAARVFRCQPCLNDLSSSAPD